MFFAIATPFSFLSVVMHASLPSIILARLKRFWFLLQYLRVAVGFPAASMRDRRSAWCQDWQLRQSVDNVIHRRQVRPRSPTESDCSRRRFAPFHDQVGP